MNVGASAPEDAGMYFSWGNSPGHEEGSGYNFSQEVYDETPGAAIETNLTLAEDMARQSIGMPWRLPTVDEFQELIDNCTSVWTTRNGVSGRLFTSNVNGASIFLPAAGNYSGTSLNYRGSLGDYWSSTYYSATHARSFSFYSSSITPPGNDNRRYGFPIRAVAKL